MGYNQSNIPQAFSTGLMSKTFHAHGSSNSGEALQCSQRAMTSVSQS